MPQFAPSRDSSPEQSLERASTAIVAAVVCLAIGLALVPGLALGDDERADDRSYATQDSTNVSIDDSLTATEGTVDVFVSLTGLESGDEADLKTHASQTRADLETFTEQTDGVTVRNTFWLTNAVLLEVDTDRVSLDTIAGVANVESLSSNAPVSAHTGEGEDDRVGVGTPGDGDAQGGASTGEETTESGDLSRTEYERNAHDDAHENDGTGHETDGDANETDGGSTGAFGAGFGIFVALAAGGGLAALLARRH